MNKFKFITIAEYGHHPQPGQYFWLEMIVRFLVLSPNCDCAGLGLCSRSQPSLLPSSHDQPPHSCRKNFLGTSAKGNQWEFSGLGLECVTLTEARMLQMNAQPPRNGEVSQAQPALTGSPLPENLLLPIGLRSSGW